MRPRGRSQVLSLTVRPETKALIDELAESYHLSRSAIMTTAIVEFHKSRIGQPEKRKRGNGHT